MLCILQSVGNSIQGYSKKTVKNQRFFRGLNQLEKQFHHDAYVMQKNITFHLYQVLVFQLINYFLNNFCLWYYPLNSTNETQ